jgi:rhodanese-related sulfurtransferase
MSRTVQDLLELARGAVKRVDVADALALFNSGAHVVDVRKPPELAAQGAIPRAVNLPRSNLEWLLDSPRAPRRWETIVFYRGSGGRSLLSAQRAAEMGFVDARTLDGGFKGWVAAGAPVHAISG